MAWRPPGVKPLSEPMMVSLPMHIYVTRPQCVNNAQMLSDYKFTLEIYIQNISILTQI